MDTSERKYQLAVCVWRVADAPSVEPEEGYAKYEILERYYNDIYKLFLAKLTSLERATSMSEEDKNKLKQLLDEIIYVKTLLEEEK